MPELPPDVTAALAALRFAQPDISLLAALTASDWSNLLTRHDFLRLAIPLRQTWPEEIPEWVRFRIDRHIADNVARLERIKADYFEIAAALEETGAAHLVMKGFAQWPGFTDHPCFHLQSDIDLYCLPASIDAARRAVLSLGYEPEKDKRRKQADHLPALVRRNGWHWRGNYFDPEMPPAVELHHSFWDKNTFRFGVAPESDFWLRRITRSLDGFEFPALSLADNLGHSALQILKDCLEDALSVAKLYELARFLHLRRDDCAFWSAWQSTHQPDLRQMEAIAFSAAADVFACDLPEPVAAEVHGLPLAVHKWFELFGSGLFDQRLHRPSAGVWLQIALVESAADRRAVALKHFLPRRPVSFEAFSHREEVVRKPLPDPKAPSVRQKYIRYIRKRAIARARAFIPELWRGARYWWSIRNLSRDYASLYAAAFVFDLGMYIFFLLYNLLLIDRGFSTRFLGFVTSASALGSVAGTFLGGALFHRFGLRTILLACFPLVAVICFLRSIISIPSALICLAFLGGAAATFWAVGLSPAVAQMTDDRNRSFGFSVILSTGIAVGVLGGFAGGHLPGWLSHGGTSSAVHAKQGALLIASALIALAAWPISRIRFRSVQPAKRALFSRNPFLMRFLPAIAVWSLVTGGFAPFFNAYFSQQLGMSVRSIGAMFSLSHLSQMFAVLLAPILFRRAGLIKGVMTTQILTGIALACLATAPAGWIAAAIYTLFSAFEWMNEPGIFTLLMNRVSPEERTAASAMMFFVIAVANSAAAGIAGVAYTKFGYPPVMFTLAGVALVAAVLFERLLSGETSAETQARGSLASVKAN